MIFNNVAFLNEQSSSEKKYEVGFELGRNIISENGGLIKNCDFAITDDLVFEAAFDLATIEECALLEGAKLNLKLKNFMDEGADYKGLKKDLREIIKANDLSDEELRTGKNEFMHICKRILQVLCDISVIFGGMYASGQVLTGLVIAGVTGQPAILLATALPSILGFVIGFIINRLERLLWDTIEFNAIKKDAEDIVRDLRAAAKKNPKMEKKFNSEADRLEASIKKYSNKRKDKED